MKLLTVNSLIIFSIFWLVFIDPSFSKMLESVVKSNDNLNHKHILTIIMNTGTEVIIICKVKSSNSNMKFINNDFLIFCIKKLDTGFRKGRFRPSPLSVFLIIIALLGEYSKTLYMRLLMPTYFPYAHICIAYSGQDAFYISSISIVITYLI